MPTPLPSPPAMRAIPVMLAIVLFVMTGMGMVIPVLSLYAESFGVGSTLIGLIITAFGVARLFVNLPGGLISERHGRRVLLWGGPLVLALGSAGAALADGFLALLVWRFVQGVGSGLYMTGAVIAITDLSDRASRGRHMGAYQTALLTGTAIGPALGGLLAERWGYAAPFWGFAGASALAALAAFLVVPETRRPSLAKAAHGAAYGADVAELLRHRGFRLVALITFGVFFTRTAAQWQLIPLVAAYRFAMAPGAIGLALALSALATLATTPLSGWLADRLPRRPLIVASAAAVAACLVLIALSGSEPVFWAALMLLGAALALGAPAANAFAADCAPEGRLGATLGLLRTAGDVGFVAGPLAAGLAVDASGIGHSAGILFNAALMAVAAAAFGAGGAILSPVEEPIR